MRCYAAVTTDTCKHCGQPIRWAVNDKRMRVAVEATPGGTLVLLPADPDGGIMLPRISDVSRYAPNIVRSIVYRKHSESCPGRSRRR